jgi:hypothetical protein
MCLVEAYQRSKKGGIQFLPSPGKRLFVARLLKKEGLLDVERVLRALTSTSARRFEILFVD